MEISESKQTEYLRRVRDAYPGLGVDAGVVRATSGQSNDVLIFDEELVFRFPKNPQAARTLATETALLRALRGRLPLPVPDPAYSGGADPRTGEQSFVGYRAISGEPLFGEAFEAGTTALRMASQLADFLQHLHALPVDELGVRLPQGDDAGFWERMHAAFQDELFGFMRPEAQESVTRRFGSFLNEPGNFTWRPVLRHGDFGGTNILHDPTSREVTGVIDFGSAALGDPAVDLAAVSHYGPGFLEVFYSSYPALSSWPTRRRADFYRGTHALQQALWARRAGDEEEFEDGIAAYA